MCFGLFCACGEPVEEGKTDISDISATEGNVENNSTDDTISDTDSAMELVSQIRYAFTRERDGQRSDEEMVIDVAWTENGATVEGYQDSDEGRADMHMELVLDDQNIPTSIIKTINRPDGETIQTTISFSYPEKRRVKVTTTPHEGSEYYVLFVLDESGRVIREEYDGYTRGYEYDSNGNCVRDWIHYAEDEERNRDTNTVYTYDESGKILFSVESNLSNGKETQKHYYYYPNGNVMYVLSVSSFGIVNHNFCPYNTKDFTWSYGMTDGAGMEYEVEKDSNGYIVKVVTKSFEETRTTTFEYDEKGNLIKELVSGGKVCTWEYDSQNRPMKYIREDSEEFGGVTYTTIYEYDDFGHLIYQKRTDSDGQSDTETWSYNDAGMVVSKTESDVYSDDEGTMEQSMEIQYVENSHCTISEEWAEFFLKNFLNSFY